MHSELDFRPVQVISSHVIYNSPYKYWPYENDLWLDKTSHLITRDLGAVDADVENVIAGQVAVHGETVLTTYQGLLKTFAQGLNL